MRTDLDFGFKMASWNEWFIEARRRGLSLDKYLKVNISRDTKLLQSSGLPCYDRRIIPGKKFLEDKTGIQEFCRTHEKTWVRVYNEDLRYSEVNLRGYDEVTGFVSGLDIDLTQFKIQLFEFHENRFGGNILSNQDGVAIEVAEGLQDIVGKCLGDFFHGRISSTGRLKFQETYVPQELVRASWETLNYIKLNRGEYLPGYFEFIVSDKNAVFFLAYKTDLK